jgi:hypothetical protein
VAHAPVRSGSHPNATTPAPAGPAAAISTFAAAPSTRSSLRGLRATDRHTQTSREQICRVTCQNVVELATIGRRAPPTGCHPDGNRSDSAFATDLNGPGVVPATEERPSARFGWTAWLAERPVDLDKLERETDMLKCNYALTVRWRSAVGSAHGRPGGSAGSRPDSSQHRGTRRTGAQPLLARGPAVGAGPAARARSRHPHSRASGPPRRARPGLHASTVRL